ncbi:Fis family transcriptional regulator [Sphingobium cupriresistens]|uniref:Fis family transcriptional regulator n=2 Tax=Sphingobium cupriresistens TaxID=1132417 RepID=A0A8G1ZII4_9SPHN|nr:CAP domain-containing protein [Sphingobium cupriresistens]RYM13533.1 Fis family transcriptional regulator [Sphingobium cupriresistens]
MAGGSPKAFLRPSLWAAMLPVLLATASGAQAASDSDGRAPKAGAAIAVMSAAYYGMAEAARSDRLLRAAMLDAHNGERASLGLPLLDWDQALATDAARYAGEMARSGVFRHSPRAGRAIPSGENLWMGPRRLYDYQVMVGSFLEEKRFTRIAGKLPDLSSAGRWQDVGHYTQMIWRGTRKVGCALGEGTNADYLVCRYFPAGNAFGRGPMDADDEPAPPTAGTPGAQTQAASAAP